MGFLTQHMIHIRIYPQRSLNATTIHVNCELKSLTDIVYVDDTGLASHSAFVYSDPVGLNHIRTSTRTTVSTLAATPGNMLQEIAGCAERYQEIRRKKNPTMDGEKRASERKANDYHVCT